MSGSLCAAIQGVENHLGARFHHHVTGGKPKDWRSSNYASENLTGFQGEAVTVFRQKNAIR